MSTILRHNTSDFSPLRGRDRYVKLYRSPSFRSQTAFIDESTQITVGHGLSLTIDDEVADMEESFQLLKQMLLPHYHYNEALFDANFNSVLLLSHTSVYRLFRWIAPSPLASTDVKRVHIAFRDFEEPYIGTPYVPVNVEFDPYSHQSDYYRTDLNDSLGSAQNSLAVHTPEKFVGKIFQVNRFNPTHGFHPIRSRNFRELLRAVENGTGLYAHPYGLQNFNDQIQFQYDVEPASAPEYFATLMYDYLISLGIEISEASFLPPEDLSAVLTDSTVNLSWQESGIVHGYNVYVNGIKHNSEVITDLSYQILGLADGDYEIWATSVSGERESEPGNIIQLRMGVTVQPPQNFSVELIRTEINPPLNFNVELIATSVPPQNFQVELTELQPDPPRQFDISLINHSDLIPENFATNVIHSSGLAPANFQTELIQNSALIPKHFSAQSMDKAELIPQNFHAEPV